eukprot:2710066-Alexandrium_andersonii.AAC.1
MHGSTAAVLPCPAVAPGPVVLSKRWDAPRVTALEDSTSRSSWGAPHPAQLALPAPGGAAATPGAGSDSWNAGGASDPD